MDLIFKFQIMRYILIGLYFFCVGCKQESKNIPPPSVVPISKPFSADGYRQLLRNIHEDRTRFSAKYASANDLLKPALMATVKDYWVKHIGEDLFQQWQATPWDFNGTATFPREGSIACGYFVTTMLRDMDLKINRQKLSVCASSEMMRQLAPGQKLANLSRPSMDAFDSIITKAGKAVYIIGLDFHTGFIVNDGTKNWFIHSNYIRRRGVTKEPVLLSAALRSSKTRWLVNLTNDRDFLSRWIRG